jgi:hypothetical protein
MCFSAKASLLSFTIGLVGAFLCISLGSVKDKIIGYFLGFVSLMQGIEYLLWSHQKCDSYNRFISFIGMCLNHLQPLVLGIILLVVNKNIKNIKNKDWIYLVMLFYFFILFLYSLQFFLTEKENQCTLKNTANHLQWNWNLLKYNRWIYFLFLFTMCALFLLGMPTLKSGINCSFVAILSYSTSAILYNDKDVGALWCYYTAFLPLLYYFSRIMF